MRQAATVTYWFCTAAAVVLILLGIWDTLFGVAYPKGILIFCFAIAAVFYLAGMWVRRRAVKASET